VSDTLFRGRIVLAQPARGDGYRVNVDAILLAAFAASRGATRSAFDLGAGVGAVTLSLLHLGAVDRATLIERDANAAALAKQNLLVNGFAMGCTVLCADVEAAAARHPGEASLCVCNPPYVRPGRGRAAKGAARETARSGALEGFVRAASRLCGRRSRACFVYPAHDLTLLLATLYASGLEPKRLRMVHATSASDARVVLVEAQHAKAGGLRVERPLVERVGSAYSPELRALLEA
jgi:tRNA1Val (adenine37-N6)-methyltransferase